VIHFFSDLKSIIL